MRGHHKPHTPEARGRQSAAAKKRRKVPCRFCPKRLSVSAIGRHEQACELNPDSLAAKRLAEVAICPRDLREFYPWKRTKSPKGGVSWQRNEFCCRTCAIEFRHDQRRENGWCVEPSSGELARRENAGKRLVDWNRRNGWVAQRAQAGRPKPNLRIIRPEAQLRAAALLSEYTGATIVTSPKIDGRLLVDHSGTANPRAQCIVRLADGKVYDYGRQAASEIDGTDTGISEAINSGSYHRGHQFMLHDAWISAGRPSRHPLNTADPPVEKPPRDELDRIMRECSLDQAGDYFGVNGITVRNWAISYGLDLQKYDKRRKDKPEYNEIDAFMRDHTWNEAEKHFGLVHKTLRKCLVSGDFDPSVYDKRQTYVGANNPTAVRVIRLTDQKVYETGRQAAQDIGVADTGVWAAIRYGTPSRGHHFMRYDEWIAAGKPNAHPSVPGPVGVNSR